MARIGLRMMPPFPSSPLRFRTAGFPQYGSKVGLSDRAFPDPASVKLAPSIPVAWIRFASTLRALRCSMGSPFSVGGHLLGGAPPCEQPTSLYSRGPRSGPGFVVPAHQHLTGPIRPTRGHIAISPHSGLYAMPSLCGSAEATRERFRAFAVHSFLTCHPLRPRGVRHRSVPGSDVDIGLRQRSNGSALPKFPQSVSRGGKVFEASTVRIFATACQFARHPVRI
jgi:hypothetical protein